MRFIKKMIRWSLYAFLGLIALGVVGSVFSSNDDNATESVSDEEEVEQDTTEADSKDKATDKESVSDSKGKEKNKKIEEDPDYKALEKDFDNLVLSSDGIIIKIGPNAFTDNYQQMEMYVDGNTWEASTETEKIEFAEAIHGAIEDSLHKHKIIDRDMSAYLTIYDQNDYELARQSIWSGKFELKR